MSTESASRSGKPEQNSSGFPNWLYLIFLAFLLLGPAFDPEATTASWVLVSAIAVLAGVVYVAGYRSRTFRLPAAVTLLVIGIAGTWLGLTAMGVLPIYASALVGSFGTRRQVVRRLALISVITIAVMPLASIPMPFLLIAIGPALPLIWLVGLSVHEDVNLNLEADQLRAENMRIEYLATVTERERIARDLHDLAGQALTAVALRSQLVQRLAETDPQRVREEASAIEETARETLSSLRETVAGWQQINLEDELDKGLDSLRIAGVRSEVEGNWDQDLAPSVETVLGLALREAVTNVVRHSQAGQCTIRLNGNPGEVVLSVSDDGIGFTGPDGSGLRGMRERVTAAAGRVERHFDGGTDLRISIPVGGP